MLPFTRHLDLLSHDTMRMVGALRQADPGASVPGCPDWGAGDLLTHLIEMNDIWGWLVANRPRDFDEGFEPIEVPGEQSERLELLDGVNHRLVEALRHSGPDEPVCYFGSSAPAARVARLMATETVVHSRDAEQTAGLPATPIPADVAVDSIAQQIAHLSETPGDDAEPRWLPHGVALTCTDTGDSWTVLAAETGLDATLRLADSAPIGAQVAGPAASLLSWVFARSHEVVPASESGDTSLLRVLHMALGHEVEPVVKRNRWWRR